MYIEEKDHEIKKDVCPQGFTSLELVPLQTFLSHTPSSNSRREEISVPQSGNAFSFGAVENV